MRLTFFTLLCCLLFIACEHRRAVKTTNYERIVVLGQAATEMLLKFDVSDRVVGVSYLDTPKLIEGYPNISILSTGWTDKETILRLQPDLIFAMEAAFRADRIGNRDFWEERGVKTFIVDDYRENKSFETFYNDILVTSELFQQEDKGRELIEKLTDLSNSYQLDCGGKRVLHLSYISGSQFYYYPPEMCLLDEIIEGMGGEYINLGDRSFILPIETILSINPDKIVLSQFRKQDKEPLLNMLLAHPLLSRLDAVIQNQVLEVDYSQAIRGSFEMESIYSEVYKFLEE